MAHIAHASDVDNYVCLFINKIRLSVEIDQALVKV